MSFELVVPVSCIAKQLYRSDCDSEAVVRSHRCLHSCLLGCDLVIVSEVPWQAGSSAPCRASFLSTTPAVRAASETSFSIWCNCLILCGQ
jgi:hypothetical protein